MPVTNGTKSVLVALLVVMSAAVMVNALVLFLLARNQQKIIADAFQDLTR